MRVGCEQFREGLLGQPANAVTSLAFVVAALVILWRYPRGPQRGTYALLVAAVGVGSAIQHGPHPAWQAYTHDLPLAGLLAFVAADAASDLVGRRLSALWWLVPTAAMVPVVAAGSRASTLAQAALATVAIGLNLARARARPALRRTLITALAVLAVGALAGSLSDRTDLCRPESLLQGHAFWHVLAAVALTLLTPAIGHRRDARPW